MIYVYAELEFRGAFTSYSPTLYEGYIDSTTLQAALTAIEAELLGNSKPFTVSARFSSLLPLATDKSGGKIHLLPPLRLPQAGKKVFGFWTPRAADTVLSSLDKHGAIIMVYDGDTGKYCLLDARKATINMDTCRLVYDERSAVIHMDDEEIDFRPPAVRSDRHRLVIDRVTGAATPYTVPVVEPRQPRYWFAAVVHGEGASDVGRVCGMLEASLKLLDYVGLGAYRSAGFGRAKLASFKCGKDVHKVFPNELLQHGDSRYAVTLGLLLPRASSCSIVYGRSMRFGSYRGYGGRVLNFRRPLVVAAAPGSVVRIAGDVCEGATIAESAPVPFSYSFNPLLYPVAV